MQNLLENLIGSETLIQVKIGNPIAISLKPQLSMKSTDANHTSQICFSSVILVSGLRSSRSDCSLFSSLVSIVLGFGSVRLDSGWFQLLSPLCRFCLVAGWSGLGSIQTGFVPSLVTS